MLIEVGIPKAWAERAASRHTQAQIELALLESRVRIRLGRTQDANRWLRTEIGVPHDAIDPKAAPKPTREPGPNSPGVTCVTLSEDGEPTTGREGYRAAIERRTGERAA